MAATASTANGPSGHRVARVAATMRCRSASGVCCRPTDTVSEHHCAVQHFASDDASAPACLRATHTPLVHNNGLDQIFAGANVYCIFEHNSLTIIDDNTQCDLIPPPLQL